MCLPVCGSSSHREGFSPRKTPLWVTEKVSLMIVKYCKCINSGQRVMNSPHKKLNLFCSNLRIQYCNTGQYSKNDGGQIDSHCQIASAVLKVPNRTFNTPLINNDQHLKIQKWLKTPLFSIQHKLPIQTGRKSQTYDTGFPTHKILKTFMISRVQCSNAHYASVTGSRTRFFLFLYRCFIDAR